MRPASALDTLESKEEEGAKKELKEAEDLEVVFIKHENKAKIRPVKTGIQDDKYIEVLSGLKPGEIVITGPYSAVSKFLKHNDVVKEVSKEELFSSKTKQD
jgi:HlyD family secretion protein